jgi:hypothetical protein
MARKGITLVCLLAGMLLAAALFGVARYGSLEASLAALRAQPLVVENAVMSFGTLSVGQTANVEFDLRNLGERRIELVGCQTTCDCVATSALPTAVEPRGRRRMRFDIKPDRADADYAAKIKVLTDVPTQPTVALSITGEVIERSTD